MNNIQRQAEKICIEFFSYTRGTRIIFLMHRKKERGQNCDKKHLRKISYNPEEFHNILIEFLKIMQSNPKIPYRIYSSVNARDIDKGIKDFKIRQLEADSSGGEDKRSFYAQIHNRMISSLSKPSSRVSEVRSFMIDCDSEEEFTSAKKILAGITKNWKHYRTKNGRHIIVQPFDVRYMPDHSINKDGLLLLKY